MLPPGRCPALAEAARPRSAAPGASAVPSFGSKSVATGSAGSTPKTGSWLLFGSRVTAAMTPETLRAPAAARIRSRSPTSIRERTGKPTPACCTVISAPVAARIPLNRATNPVADALMPTQTAYPTATPSTVSVVRTGRRRSARHAAITSRVCPSSPVDDNESS